MWRMYSIDGVLFVLHRVTGVALFIYLIAHILTISTAMLAGAETFDKVMAALAAPAFLVVDLTLFACLLFHALNGLRLIAHERGLLIDRGALVSRTVLGAWVGLLAVVTVFVLAY
jgi:succinate dehydrogenase / fumarate reductase, cytochrome b subunit